MRHWWDTMQIAKAGQTLSRQVKLRMRLLGFPRAHVTHTESDKSQQRRPHAMNRHWDDRLKDDESFRSLKMRSLVAFNLLFWRYIRTIAHFWPSFLPLTSAHDSWTSEYARAKKVVERLRSLISSSRAKFSDYYLPISTPHETALPKLAEALLLVHRTKHIPSN